MTDNDISPVSLNTAGDKRSSIVLIGMPGAGKSSIGSKLAAKLGSVFIDTDDAIKASEKLSLQTIIDRRGYLHFRAIEERVLLSLELDKHLVATGGSAVYSSAGMQHLKSQAIIVYLDVPNDELKIRITNMHNRGIACRKGETLEDIHRERDPLYRRYADVTIDCSKQSADHVVKEIATKVSP